jgi:hypothetical protein
MSMGVKVAALGFTGTYCILVKVADPKFASVGCVEPTAVGNSSIHSAEAAGPV